ncbi:OB-fold nucleic acid binding domain-containing protein [Solicola gregarius]|uniref:OB-fold nucleic acid binding domain-containing protein n=1 Tax=Solicola gregarius TaxID=2908642 RepID=A0AA46TI29_9ACTN|nr:OB-fold nucleic acid binding domain-containing protein [Solicola gregarius]UYM05254.1 OB-fold nucleic acid binding domain-containing protein [Solicola gregarius]
MPRLGAKDHRGGMLGRALGRLATPTASIEDAEMRDDAAKAGCELIADKADRQQATLHGTLRSVTLRPRGGVPALEAELCDGSGSVLVVWLGRRRIEGITPGRQLTVHGRLGAREGEPVLFNPRYELSA